MFRAIVLALSLFGVSTVPAAADSASHRQATENLLLLMNVPAMLNQLDGVFENAMSQTFEASNPPPEARPVLEKYMSRMTDIMSEEVSWDAMKDMYVDLYVEAFTEAEIKQLSTFFESDIGKKYTGKTPELMQSAMVRSEQRMRGMQQRIQTLMQEMVQELESLQ